MSRLPHWRELHQERLREALAALAGVDGLRGLILGGSVARGEHWPLSDIDILPLWRAGQIQAEQLQVQQARMVDWWAASGRAQTLDVSWLHFMDAEAVAAVKTGTGGAGAIHAAERMSDLRWLHGLDKIYGGRGEADPDGLADRFARWATAVRLQPSVCQARALMWQEALKNSREQMDLARERGQRHIATLHLREAARTVRLILVESWGTRLGSMGREWTHWERLAADRDHGSFAAELADVADANPDEALGRKLPYWLVERVKLAFEARQLVRESVSEAESARDQVAAFSVHVSRRSQPPWPEWMRIPDPELESKSLRLDDLIRQLPGGHGLT